MKLHFPALLSGLAVLSVSALQANNNDKKLYEDLIVPVLSAKCAGCHGDEKQKGKLRVDSLEAILKGGSEGASVVPGKVDESSLIQRVYLPIDDDEHMPPEGKDQLSGQETAVLAFWINSGAKAGVRIGDLKPDEKTNAAIAHVIGNLPKAAVMVAKEEAPKLNEAQEKVIAETIGRIEDAGASLMPIAQDTPELRFSALNVAKEFSDDGLLALKPVSEQLKWVDLARTQVTDAGLAHLKGMNNLTRLHLENTKVTDAGIAHLAGLSNLEYLNLYGTQISDAGIAKLAGLKNLKKVFLWQSKVTDAGAKKLAAAIPGLEANTGWKASAVEPVALVANTKDAKPAAPAPKPAAKPSTPAPKPAAKPTTPAPAPKPVPAPAPKPETKPAPANPLFDKAIAELKAASTAADQKAAKAKADFDTAIREVDAATKKAQALKGQSEKAALVAKEAKAALEQLMKAAEAGK
ncbi:MAG: hypothetical protein P1U81_18780 [Verrucomicrobiales bacterium]|nr:hypothetical protein [Verrucomicrobiales bacterium]